MIMLILFVIVQKCIPGLVFNSAVGYCDYAYNTPPPCGVSKVHHFFVTGISIFIIFRQGLVELSHILNVNITWLMYGTLLILLPLSLRWRFDLRGRGMTRSTFSLFRKSQCSVENPQKFICNFITFSVDD